MQISHTYFWYELLYSMSILSIFFIMLQFLNFHGILYKIEDSMLRRINTIPMHCGVMAIAGVTFIDATKVLFVFKFSKAPAT